MLIRNYKKMYAGIHVNEITRNPHDTYALLTTINYTTREKVNVK